MCTSVLQDLQVQTVTYNHKYIANKQKGVFLLFPQKTPLDGFQNLIAFSAIHSLKYVFEISLELILILYIPVNNFSLVSGWVFLG